MKRLFFYLILISLPFIVKGQEKVQVEDKIFNFGATIGLQSSQPVINSLSIDGIEADNIQMHYRVGFFGSVFCRININRIFLQPSISWTHSSGELRFTLPTEIDNTSSTEGSYYDLLNMVFESVELPMLVGYKIVKEGPYGLSLMIGPKLKYNYKTDYTFDISSSRNRFNTNSRRFDVNIVTGVGVSIWRLFFDFKYEFGLNKMDSDFKNLSSSEDIRDILIDKRINVMSFSLGFLF